MARAVSSRRARALSRKLSAEPLESRWALSVSPAASASGALAWPLANEGLAGASAAAQSALAAITTTAPKDVRAFGWTQGDAAATDDFASETLLEAVGAVGLPTFRQDPRFVDVDGRGFSIVVLDSGIDLAHPFFGPDENEDGVADRIVYSQSFVADDPSVDDGTGHGTHVTSIAASGDGVYVGAAPGADIIHLRVLDQFGSGTASAIEQALQWVAANVDAYNIASVNLSFSFNDNHSQATTQPALGLYDELAAIAAQDVIIVGAAGNQYFSYQNEPGVAYPAADPSVVAVGATWDADLGGPFEWLSGAVDLATGVDHIASFSQRSPVLTDVMAPGALITAAGVGGGLSTRSGTSMASPLVAGVAAVMQQLAGETLGRRLTSDEFAAWVRQTGTALYDGDDEVDNVANTAANYGRLNVPSLAEAIVSGGLADLTIPAGPVLSSSTLPAGGTVRFDFTIANQGVSASGPVVTKVYLSADDVLDETDLLLAAIDDELAAGAVSARFGHVVSLPGTVVPGEYFFGLVVDGDGSVAEANETNNAALEPLTVTGDSGEIWIVDVSTGQLVPSQGSSFDFGRLVQDDPDANRWFEIHNDGNVALTLTNVSFPVGFASPDLPAAVAPGQTVQFQIVMSGTQAPGDFAGAATFDVNDADESPFTINLLGSVLPPDDHGGDAAHATVVAAGSTTAGTILPTGDVDWFRFAAVAGVDYQFHTILDALADSTLRLLAADGTTVLATNDDGPAAPASQIVWTAPADGDYYLEVAGVGEGSYSLAIAAGDDHGDSASAATPLTEPATAGGALETPGDEDWFAFRAVGGTAYELSTVLGTLADSTLRIVARDGSVELAINDDGPNPPASQLNWTAPKDGLYYAVVASASPAGIGSYELVIQGDDDHGDLPATATLLTPPATLAGMIDVPFDVDWFRVNVVAGAEYEFAVELGTLSDSILQLYAADGTTLVAEDDDGGGGLASQIVWAASTSGVAYLKVQGYEWRSGGYNLSATVLDDHGEDSTHATPTTDPSVNPGIIETTADVDWFALAVVEGVTYQAATTLGDLSDARLRVYAADGVTLLAESANAGGAPLLDWTAAADETVFVEVAPLPGAAVGDYLLTLAGEDDFGDDAANAAPLTIPASVPGFLEQQDDQDWFRFVGATGVRYRFDLEPGGPPGAVVRIFALDGSTELAVNSGGNHAAEWTVLDEGTYFVSVSTIPAASTANINPQNDDYVLRGEISGVVPGDYNGDQLVDGADVLTWQVELGTAQLAADGDGDGVVDGEDHDVWQNHFGLDFSTPNVVPAAASTATPPLTAIVTSAETEPPVRLRPEVRSSFRPWGEPGQAAQVRRPLERIGGRSEESRSARDAALAADAVQPTASRGSLTFVDGRDAAFGEWQ